MSRSLSQGRSPSGSPALATKDLVGRTSSPVLPLAPLAYLQTQRRGSITDPSLHAATSNSSLKQSLNSQFLKQHPEVASSSVSDSFVKHANEPRPASPFVFGDASSSHNPQLRRLLRSPSFDNDLSRPSTNSSQGSEEGMYAQFPHNFLIIYIYNA
jgi:hypothetical protein